MTVCYSTVGRTDTGLIRNLNEDTILIDRTLNLLIVADGMGGHSTGEIASQTAIQIIQQSLSALVPAQAPGIPHTTDRASTNLQYLVDCLDRTNTHLHALNQSNGYPDGCGMGTTAVGCWLFVEEQKMLVFNIGDSRLYRLRNEQLQQLTKDHSLLQEWKDQGSNGTPPEANVILQALGPYPEIEPEMQILSIEENDRLLLCSDGLYGMLDESSIADCLSRMDQDNLDALCSDLIEQANLHGGRDNISAILCLCHGDSRKTPHKPAVLAA